MSHPLGTLMSMDHPWRRLRDLTDWRLDWQQLPTGTDAQIDWRGHTITVDLRLSQAQRRSTLAHELEHVASGPAPAWDRDREGVRVERAAARRLVTLDELVDAARWTRYPDELWIDADMLDALVDGLTPAERAAVEAAID